MRCGLIVLSLVALCQNGCSCNSSSNTDSTIRTSPLGYTASLNQQDTIDLVNAGRDHDAIVTILNRISANFPWAKVLTKLILEHNEQFRKEIETKNGSLGVVIDVWGLRKPEGDVASGTEWFQSDIEKAILPESWHKNREMSRAAQTVTLHWTVKSRN